MRPSRGRAIGRPRSARCSRKRAGRRRDDLALRYRYAYPLRPERRDRWLELCGPAITRIPVETFGAEAPASSGPRLDDEHDAYAWCTFSEAERRLSWLGEPGTLEHLGATLAVLRGALLDDRAAPGPGPT